MSGRPGGVLASISLDQNIPSSTNCTFGTGFCGKVISSIALTVITLSNSIVSRWAQSSRVKTSNTSWRIGCRSTDAKCLMISCSLINTMLVKARAATQIRNASLLPGTLLRTLHDWVIMFSLNVLSGGLVSTFVATHLQHVCSPLVTKHHWEVGVNIFSSISISHRKDIFLQLFAAARLVGCTLHQGARWIRRGSVSTLSEIGYGEKTFCPLFLNTKLVRTLLLQHDPRTFGKTRGKTYF